MRTLILLAVLTVSQMTNAQPFFIDSEPVIIQNQDGTYGWLDNGTLVPVNQPKGRIFSWKEMTAMQKGGIERREEVLKTTNIFSLTKPPFFSINELVYEREFFLTDSNSVTGDSRIFVRNKDNPWALVLGSICTLVMLIVAI